MITPKVVQWTGYSGAQGANYYFFLFFFKKNGKKEGEKENKRCNPLSMLAMGMAMALRKRSDWVGYSESGEVGRGDLDPLCKHMSGVAFHTARRRACSPRSIVSPLPMLTARLRRAVWQPRSLAPSLLQQRRHCQMMR